MRLVLSNLAKFRGTAARTQSVGVMGDERTYDYTIAIRAPWNRRTA